MSRHAVCGIGELPPGSRKVFVLDRESVGVLNVEGALYAVRNTCPHQGGPLCHGTVGGTFLPSNPHEYVYGLEGKVLRCPWHAWEFDLRTGRAIFAPDRVRIKVYPVAVEDGIVVVEV